MDRHASRACQANTNKLQVHQTACSVAQASTQQVRARMTSHFAWVVLLVHHLSRGVVCLRTVPATLATLGLTDRFAACAWRESTRQPWALATACLALLARGQQNWAKQTKYVRRVLMIRFRQRAAQKRPAVFATWATVDQMVGRVMLASLARSNL
jgi:hypothetical protein